MRDSQQQISPSRTVVTSFTPKTTVASELNNSQSSSLDYFEQGDWVLGVTACHKWVSCALSNGEVQVYDQDSMRLRQTYKMNTAISTTGNANTGHHRHLVTDLVGDLSSANPNTLVTTATDGTITLFDIRQSVPAFSMKLPRPDEQALSVSLGFEGSLVAVGTSKSNIHFYDVRNSRSLLGTYNQAHTQGVTKVRFQTLSSFGTTSTTSPILVSGAEDGLACVFDTSQPSEETALKNVLAVQSPIRQVGFFGPQSEAIYCLTGDESLKLYHMEDSICRKDYGSQLREYLSHLLRGGDATSSSQSQSQSQSQSSLMMEYLVDCYWDTARQELLLCAGNTSGDAGLFKVQEHDISLSHRLAGGHRGVIRALGSLSTNVFVTVGEDARMCEWNRLGRQLHAAAHAVPPPKAPETVRRLASPVAAPKAKTGGGPMRRQQQQRGRMTASPY